MSEGSERSDGARPGSGPELADEVEPGDMLDSPDAGRRVVVGGALRVIGFVLGVAASVVGAALITRHLGPADYGRFQRVVGLLTIVQAVTDLGMTTLGLREYAQRRGADRDHYMRVLLGLRLGMTLVGIALATLAAVMLGWDLEMIAGAAAMGVGVVIAILAGTVGIPLQVELRLGWVAGIDVGRQLLTTLLYVVLVLIGTGIVPLLASTIVVYAAVLAVTLVLVRGTISLRPVMEPRAWAALVRPSVTFTLATAVGMLYVYAALVICGQVASPYETGVFSAAFRVFAIIAAVPAVLVTTAFPVLARAARDDRARLAYATQRLFEGTALLGGAALVGCVLGAGPVIDVVAGEQFAAAADVLRLQGIALAMTCVIASWGFTLLALHRHVTMLVTNLVAFVVSGVTVAILARSHGAIGAAYGTLLGELVLAAGYAYGLAGSDRLMRPRLARVARIVPALVLALACWWLPVPELVSTIAGLALFALLALGLGAVPLEIREHLPGPLRRFGVAGPSSTHSA